VCNQGQWISHCWIVGQYALEVLGVPKEEVRVALGVQSAANAVLNPVPFGDVGMEHTRNGMEVEI